MTQELYTPDFKAEPYWWDITPRPAETGDTLPAKIDVLVIGSGYTGLMAARETAAAGRSTLVVDAEALGYGCSSRNGGQVSTGLKPTFDQLSGRTNRETAFSIRKEGLNALEFIADFIREKSIDCDWRRNGRFLGAHNARQYDALARAMATQPKGLEMPYEMVTRADQRREIGTDHYHGGVVSKLLASLDPAKYHNELLRLAKSAGAQFADHCPVLHLDKEGQGFKATTAKGAIVARDVIVATNGYTGAFAPWHRRRVIPIGSYIIATEPRPKHEMLAIIPKDRNICDTRRVIFYYRLSPDCQRMIFGGRVAYLESDPLVSAPRLHACMSALFPQLAQVRISHSWMGYVAFTFDSLPHIGKHDGLHYAMGYCGSGISLATYFGMRIGQQVLGKKEGNTPMDNIPFQTRPLYTGYPWFLAPSLRWYRFLDRLPI